MKRNYKKYFGQQKDHCEQAITSESKDLMRAILSISYYLIRLN